MLTLADPWLHNLDPFAIDLTGTFIGDLINGGIRWYGLSYLAGFVLGYLLIRRVLTVGVAEIQPKQAMDLVVTIAIGIVLGGRLGYVIFYQPSLMTDFSPSNLPIVGEVPFWGVLKVAGGGMASHGGMIGGLAGCMFYAWRTKVRAAPLLDLMAFGAPLGLLMGRIANFINGELFGRACPTEHPLAVQFPQEISETWDAEQIADLQAFAQTQGLRGDLNKYELTDQAVNAAQEGQAEWLAYLAEHLTPRYPSQLFAGASEGLVVFAVLLVLYRKPVKAGLIGGWFCVVYALMRLLNEMFRMPDLHLLDNGQMPLVTRGQQLSLGLMALGIGIIVYALRTKGKKFGGWIKSNPVGTTDSHG